MVNELVWSSLVGELVEKDVTLVAVSKTKPAEDIKALYDLGQRDFGENYVQELVDKQAQLPEDIKWHYIGHLQTNKVKYIAPFVHLIHAVDSFKLLAEINKQAAKLNRVIDVLLQMHVAEEDTKYGMNEWELLDVLKLYQEKQDELQHVRIRGLMGMASFTDDEHQVRHELLRIATKFEYLKKGEFLDKDYFSICSMGMSSDYKIAIEEGSNMVRIGSMLFGSRTTPA